MSNDRLTGILFLDTPVFAQRMFGDSQQRQQVDHFIKSRRAQTSTFVRHQYQSTFLRAAVLCYNRLLEHRDVVAVLRETDHFKFFKDQQLGQVDVPFVTLEFVLNKQSGDLFVHSGRLHMVPPRRKRITIDCHIDDIDAMIRELKLARQKLRELYSQSVE